MSNSRISVPNVAVLMATYNGERFLAEQIESIMGQESVNVSLFIRDDRSSDATIAVIKEFQKKYDRIFLLDTLTDRLRVTKNFYSILRDTDLGDIDYIAWADQDDIWMKNKMIEAIRAMDRTGTDCYASNLINGDAAGRPVFRRSLLARMLNYLFNHKTNSQTLYDHYFEAASAGCTLVLGKKAALYFQNRVRQIYHLIPTDASHDWSTYAITRLGKFTWFIDRDSFIIYRQHGENAYGANGGMQGMRKLLDLFRSGWYRKHILMVEELYNEGNIHPAFIEVIRKYRSSSLLSRFKLAFAIARYRRKYFHRVLLFVLIIFGQFK
jgi:rhamnosyltransferase